MQVNSDDSNVTKLKNQFQYLLKHTLTLEHRYKLLYENSPVFFRTINREGIILDCNESYAKSLGYSKSELIGTSIYDTTAPESIVQMRESFETWKRTGHVDDREVWFKRKDKTTFPVLISANNLYDEKGKLIGSNTVIRDITQVYNAKKRIEEKDAKIKEQFDELKKLDALKDEFLTMITHELKTPLVPITGYVDMLASEKMGPLNEKQKEKLLIVSSSASSLLRLVSDLLDAQKIESGKLHLDKRMYSLDEIINKTVEKIRPAANSKGVTITTNLKPDLSCVCDAMRIEQVLSNLVTNSLDFCQKDTGTILIKSYVESGHTKIIVKDTGIGIKKDKLDKIFVKFYQIDTSSTREHGGTGIGLSICKGIIEGHGGKIWAESEGTGKGAEIHILLPLSG